MKTYLACIFLAFWSFSLDGFSTEKPVKVVVLGDSLTEGLGVAKNEAFPVVLEKFFHEKGYGQVKVVNGGISGDTTAGGLKRLEWHLRSKPQFLVITLGSNDALRGLAPEATKKNLDRMISKAKENKIQVLLAGARVPPNYGKKYAKKFESIYPSLKQKYKIPFVPFLLEGVAGEKKLNQSDGIHPNVEGHVKIAQTVFRAMIPMFKKIPNKKR